ncbi:hypothetical protein ACVRGS_000311, partial [Shigella flexneri]
CLKKEQMVVSAIASTPQISLKCAYLFLPPRLKSFELCLPLSTLSTLVALMPVMALLSAG